MGSETIGVIFFAADDADFRVGNYLVMYGVLSSPPTAPDTTYILHTNWTAKEALKWIDYVSYRLVIITRKPPKTKDERIIIHKSLKSLGNNKDRSIEALFRHSNRDRVFRDIQKVPIPLILAWVRRNRPHNTHLWEDLAEATFELPDKYLYAMLAFGINPSSKRIEWPQKTKEDKPPPLGYRESDTYISDILDIDEEELLWI